MLTLCIDEGGADLLELDKPIPHASETLQEWSENYKLVYLTGRTKNMRRLTLNELMRFGFPTREADLEMFALKDWMNYFASQSSVVATRSRIFKNILSRYNVVSVVDDYPGFFLAYRKYPVPNRIGFLREKRFFRNDYIANGATRVVENWRQLLNLF